MSMSMERGKNPPYTVEIVVTNVGGWHVEAQTVDTDGSLDDALTVFHALLDAGTNITDSDERTI